MDLFINLGANILKKYGLTKQSVPKLSLFSYFFPFLLFLCQIFIIFAAFLVHY